MTGLRRASNSVSSDYKFPCWFYDAIKMSVHQSSKRFKTVDLYWHNFEIENRMCCEEPKRGREDTEVQSTAYFQRPTPDIHRPKCGLPSVLTLGIRHRDVIELN